MSRDKVWEKINYMLEESCNQSRAKIKKKSERSRINKYSHGPFSELWAVFIFCGAELFPRGETEREKYKLMSSYTG